MKIIYTKNAIRYLSKQPKKNEVLPESDQRFAYEFVKKLVLAWDPNYIKVTPAEAAQIKAAEESGFIADDEIDWNEIGQ